MSFDYAAFEQCFGACSEAAVKLLVDRHNDKSPFYAICVYVDAFDGTFGLYANTLADFEHSLEQYRRAWGESYSREAKVMALKYNCGDWQYQTLYMPQDFKATFAPLEQWSRQVYDLSYKDDALTEEDFQKFDEIGCRIAMAIESSAILNTLKRTDEFVLLVCDHDEPAMAGIHRLRWFKEMGNLDGFDPYAYAMHRGEA